MELVTSTAKISRKKNSFHDTDESIRMARKSVHPKVKRHLRWSGTAEAIDTQARKFQCFHRIWHHGVRLTSHELESRQVTM